MNAKDVRTDSDLFDYLRINFGVGDWDEDHDLPWWKYRTQEVSKIKRVRTARKVALGDLATTVDYCKARRIDIRDSTWLYRHIIAALRWEREREQIRPSDFERDYEDALAQAYEHGEHEWIERLTRALGDGRQEVYAEWLKAHE